jgi:hypothetical protein
MDTVERETPQAVEGGAEELEDFTVEVVDVDLVVVLKGCRRWT